MVGSDDVLDFTWVIFRVNQSLMFRVVDEHGILKCLTIQLFRGRPYWLIFMVYVYVDLSECSCDCIYLANSVEIKSEVACNLYVTCMYCKSITLYNYNLSCWGDISSPRFLFELVDHPSTKPTSNSNFGSYHFAGCIHLKNEPLKLKKSRKLGKNHVPVHLEI